eukprot:CAMPEP_0180054100 /NCGR_PEP_ID=MMETSP0985-20121206/2650_1 /TAXON_ID=483367 /ORGANISM="non described non described, Strain CCMP 2436" /LENGTH=275 /DNA_ID=CAMNT_0021983677 /DNA_START=267 /DNA_END=1095 /DNA_ORIENTATION=+
MTQNVGCGSASGSRAEPGARGAQAVRVARGCKHPGEPLAATLSRGPRLSPLARVRDALLARPLGQDAAVLPPGGRPTERTRTVRRGGAEREPASERVILRLREEVVGTRVLGASGAEEAVAWICSQGRALTANAVRRAARDRRGLPKSQGKLAWGCRRAVARDRRLRHLLKRRHALCALRRGRLAFAPPASIDQALAARWCALGAARRLSREQAHALAGVVQIVKGAAAARRAPANQHASCSCEPVPRAQLIQRSLQYSPAVEHEAGRAPSVADP